MTYTERRIFAEFRDGASLFDLSLRWALPLAQVERAVRQGMDQLEEQAAKARAGNHRSRQALAALVADMILQAGRGNRPAHQSCSSRPR